MLSRKNKHLLLKIFSLFSVIRGYNIPIIILAQYLSTIFILAPEKRALSVLLDFHLFLIVLASSLTIASGYIINNFYDSKKDLINRPNKSMLDRLVSQDTKLKIYFTLNFIVVVLAYIVSFRAFLFFSVYIFLIWIYSHKIKKHVIIGNLMATFMAVLPFFALLLYYYFNLPLDEIENNKDKLAVVFTHALFLFLLLLIREMIKDLENIKGDLANDYRTIPILYGETISKKIITALTFLTLLPIYILIEKFNIGYMDIYFYFCLIILVFFLIYLWRANKKEQFLTLHNVLKFLIVTGVFSTILINPQVLWNGQQLLF
jgi:4-hydroxybenzoate polyprenyltransferase